MGNTGTLITQSQKYMDLKQELLLFFAGVLVFMGTIIVKYKQC